MTTFPRSRRLVLIGAVLVLGLSACGSPAPSGSPSGPAVIEIAGAAGAAGGGDTPAATEEMSPDSSTKMMAAYLEYVYSGDVPDLTSPAASWYFAPGVEPTADQVAAVAAALGVSGEMREVPADFGGGWAVGSTDYSGPSVSVSTDAMQSWYFNPGAVIEPAVMACEYYPPGDPAGGGTDATAPVCAEPQPPTGVPTADEAKAKAIALFEAMGVAIDSYDFDTYADDWNANVTGYLTLEGVRTPASITAGYGAEGALTWASGFLAIPQRGDDYPRVGVEAAVQRLNDEQSSMWSVARGGTVGGGSAGSAGIAETGVAYPEVAPDVPSTDAMVECPPNASCAPADLVDPVPAVAPPQTTDLAPRPVDLPTTCDPGADCVIPIGTPVGEEIPIGTLVGEPAPVDPITVTLTNARGSLEQVWAADDTVWLLPGYAFDSADGGWYSVIAIEDQYLAFTEVEPVPAPEPVPVETMPPQSLPPVTVLTEPPAPRATTTPSCKAPLPDFAIAAEALLGLTQAAATKVVTSSCWSLRVVRIDGEDLAVTLDYSPTRVNVATESGVITEVVSIG